MSSGQSENIGLLVLAGTIADIARSRKHAGCFLMLEAAGYKKRLVVLKWLVSHFEEGVRYPEKEVNEIIARHHPDYCTLRREFITRGLMKRENGAYWRVEWQMPDFAS